MENVVFAMAGFVYFAPIVFILAYIMYDTVKDIMNK